MHSCPAYRSLVDFSTLNHVELAIKGDIHIGIDWICMVLYDAVSYIVREWCTLQGHTMRNFGRIGVFLKVVGNCLIAHHISWFKLGRKVYMHSIQLLMNRWSAAFPCQTSFGAASFELSRYYLRTLTRVFIDRSNHHVPIAYKMHRMKLSEHPPSYSHL